MIFQLSVASLGSVFCFDPLPSQFGIIQNVLKHFKWFDEKGGKSFLPISIVGFQIYEDDSFRTDDTSNSVDGSVLEKPSTKLLSSL